jgi:hypothetical protein
MKLTAKQKTAAIRQFARTYGYSQSTVRTVSELRYLAYEKCGGYYYEKNQRTNLPG